MKTEIPYPKELKDIISSINNDRIYLVGGCVRDHFLGLTPKDFDIEVYGMEYEDLVTELKKHGKVDLVGKAFAVIKTTTENGETYDFSLPRKDNKKTGGEGHKDFIIETNTNMTEEEGAKRRDLTINSLAWNPKTKEVLDFFGGVEDLKNKVLRHTSIHFEEDPLRPLRLFQFSARFNFTVAKETAEICRKINDSYKTLPQERIREEFEKFLIKTANKKGSYLQGFKTLSQIGWINHFPEIHALENLQQDKDYHPEGDALTHTGHCMQALAEMQEWKELEENNKIITMLGVLCHDLGKATTTKKEFKKSIGREAIVSPGHDKAGEAPTTTLLTRLGYKREIKYVIPLVKHHMDHLQVKTDKEIRKLAENIEPSNIKTLKLITKADHSGRPPLPKKQPEEMLHIIKKAEELGCLLEKQQPILTGQDVLKKGTPQGKAIGVLTKKAYEAQINGVIKTKEGAINWLIENRGQILENAKLGPKRVLGGKELIELGFAAGENLGKIHKEIYNKQLLKEINTKKEALKWLISKETQEKYNIVENQKTAIKEGIKKIKCKDLEIVTVK